MKLPWMTRRALREQLAERLETNTALWGAWQAAHRELNKLDDHSDRSFMKTADRIALYINEQRMQAKADELGKPVVFVCNRRCINGYGPIDPASGIEADADTFHQHTVRPRVDDSPIIPTPHEKTFPIERAGAQYEMPSLEEMKQWAGSEGSLWQLQQAVADAKFKILKAIYQAGKQPMRGWNRVRLVAEFDAKCISQEVPERYAEQLPPGQRWLTVFEWGAGSDGVLRSPAAAAPGS